MTLAEHFSPADSFADHRAYRQQCRALHHRHGAGEAPAASPLTSRAENTGINIAGPISRAVVRCTSCHRPNLMPYALKNSDNMSGRLAILHRLLDRALIRATGYAALSG